MKWKLIDPELTQVKTSAGVITLQALFVPLFIEQLLMNMMGTVNTLVLSHYSDNAVAAVGAANQVIGLLYTFYAVVSGGASIVISRRLGEDRPVEASNAAYSTILFEGIISLVCSVVMAGFALPLMKMLNLSGETLEYAVDYFRIIMYASVLQGLMSSVSAILRSYGRPKYAVTASLIMNAINLCLNYVVIYRPFETPLSGTKGIAVVNVFARSIALIVLVIMLIRCKLELNFLKKDLTALRSMRSIIRVGLPGGISNLSYAMSQVVSTSILGYLGATVLSAKVYISSIVFYVYVIGYSLGLCSATMMGYMSGAGEYDKAFKFNGYMMRIALSINVVLSTVLFFFYEPLLGLFTENTEIIAMAKWIFLIDIFVEIGRAFNHIECNSLQGAGDVFVPMVTGIISCWGISILFAYILGIKLGLGLAGCWIAFMMDELFRGMIYWKRFRSKRWMKVRF